MYVTKVSNEAQRPPPSDSSDSNTEEERPLGRVMPPSFLRERKRPLGRVKA